MDEYRFTSITPQICNILYAQCDGVFNLLVSLFNLCHIHEAGAKDWIDQSTSFNFINKEKTLGYCSDG